MATTDGVPYSSAFVVPATNADNDLFNGQGADPAIVGATEACLAVVALTIAGGPATNSTYVVLQTDMGDGTWVDCAWCVTTSTSNGTLTFCLSAGVAGANAFQQSRAAGTAPGSSGSNQVPLGARIRFVGKAALTGGAAPSVTATIKYKLLGLR